METLEELRKEFNNLDEQRNAVYDKILRLEQQEMTNNFAVGESFKKIIKIGEGVLYCIVIENKSIERDFYYLCGAGKKLHLNNLGMFIML